VPVTLVLFLINSAFLSTHIHSTFEMTLADIIGINFYTSFAPANILEISTKTLPSRLITSASTSTSGASISTLPPRLNWRPLHHPVST